MLYRILKLLMKLAVRVFLRKVYLSGASQISRDKPLILACNHPNSFLDAVLLAVLLPRPLHFLARSDVFDRPWKRWLLSRLHLIPVYRQEEGTGHLHRNEETFRRCTEILADKGAVLVFSEGVCMLEKRLRPLRKGTARLAFFAEASHYFQLQVQVIPVSLNYTFPDSFRGEVMIGVGQPFTLRPWQDLYRSVPARAIRAFNEVLRQELEKHIIGFPSKEWEVTAEPALRANRAANPDFLRSRWYSESCTLLEEEQAIARRFPDNSVLIPPPVPEKALSGARKPGSRLLSPALWLSLPLLLPGLILNGLPAAVSWWLTRKTVKRREFYASVLLAIGLVVYLVYWLGLAAWAGLARGWEGLAFSLVVPLSAYPVLLWRDAYRLKKLRAAAGL